jgi:drug resistance transporter, Bcr/CflA subfamily|nr:Bcr/CflA family efflux MFS transporter [Methanoculleus marisnigri]
MDQSPDNDRTTRRYLGDRGLIVLIALLSAFVPLSTDLYLPALPGMGDFFGVSATLTNLTLILFFLFFSLGLLFWGPLSDRYGRRPVLLVGLTLYIAASAGCAVSWDIWCLIAFRILQAVGGSAAAAVAMAMVKDVFDGRRRESVLAIVQSMVVISPAVAPVLGAFMLPYTSWRGLFVTLALIGVVSFVGGILLEETIPSRSTGTMAQSARRLGVVLKNPGFTSLLVVFSLVSTASLAFVSASSYIYQDGFSLSERWYSFYFALNAVGLIAGPVLYLWLSRHASRRSIVGAGFVVMIGAGVLVCLFGNFGPLAFALALFPASLMGSAVRPAGAFLMLDQQREDTGSAAALINCSSLVFGSAGMVLVFLFGNSLVFGLGAINVAAGVACLLGWTAIGRRGLVKF